MITFDPNIRQIRPQVGRLSDPATYIAMRALGDYLDAIAYRDLYDIATNGGLYAPSIDFALERIEILNEQDRAVISFFALGLPQTPTAFDEAATGVISLLQACGLIAGAEYGQWVATLDYVIVPCLGGYLLVGTPPLYQTSEAIGALGYLGQDSLILAAALPRVAYKRVLDLGTGSGVQGLLAARGASEVVLTDIDEATLELAACNLLLNSPEHPTRLLQGDGYDPVSDDRFDLIVTLAPYVPSVPDSCTSRTVAGGDDGLQLIRRFAGKAFDHLSVGGEFIALAQLLCNDDGPLLIGELDQLVPNLDSRLTLSNWQPLQPYIFALATKLSEHGATISRTELCKRYSESLRGLGATGVCTAIIRLRRPHSLFGARKREVLGVAPRVRRVDIPSFANSSVNGDRQLSWITSSDGGVYACNGPTSALVQAMDGSSDIATITEQAWGPFDEAARYLDLEDQAISRLSELNGVGALRFSKPSKR